MRTAYRRPIATSLLLVGAMVLFAGCGDEGAHLPAGMTGSSAAYAGASTNGALDGVLDSDPGPTRVGVSSMVDDPVLAGYDGLDTVDDLGTDDVYGHALADWNENEGSLGGLDTDLEDDFAFEDDLMPAGYGGGGGWGDSLYGNGNGLLATASYGGGWGDAGVMDAGFADPGFEDPGFVDPGFQDAGFVDTGFDSGVANVGFDPGFVDAAAGVADAGMVDAGMVDVGFDAGAVVF